MNRIRPHVPALLFTLAACSGLAILLASTWGEGLSFELGGDTYELLQPRWIVVFALAPFLVFAATRSLADLPRAQRWLGVLSRTLLVALLSLAVARLAKTSDATRVSTIFLIDVSDSVPDAALEEAREQVRAAWEARDGGDEDNDVQLITFAREARAVPIGRDADDVPEIERHGSEEDPEAGRGTNVQGALQLAYGLFPAGHLRRVVVLSDGGQTDGDLLAEASRAKRFGIKIHVRPSRHGSPPEIAVRELELPDRIKVGEPFPVRARLFASVPSHARLRLYQGETLNGLDSLRRVELEPGETEVEFESVVRVAGPVTYRLTLEPERAEGDDPDRSIDRFAANNEYETSVVVPGKPTVLYVEGAQGSASYLARALTAADYDVDVRSPRAIPTSLREMERYDFFILSDVSADQVSMSQMDAIERYVRDLGGGFMMAGGERAFGLGGWQGTRMERLLPVRMDAERRRDQPSLALVLVIDRSGSMNGQKLELAKEAAKATAGLLTGNDYISVIGFDSRPERIVRMQSASNRLRIQRDISRLSARGGTAIFPALDMAYQDLAVTRARIKHVILLTDGQAPERGITELVQVMRAESMTVSTVGLGADVNRALLQSIANLGGGRSYLTNDPHNVPRIFMRETTTVARSAAVEEYFQPRVRSRADFLRATNIEGAPYLHGYVATRAKPSPAQVILESDVNEPILARWRVGLGWSMAWTPDVKNRWAVEWVRWSGYSQFWAQLVREHMRQKRRQRLDMQARMQGDEVHVVVDAIGGDDQFLNDMESTLRVEGPMGARQAREDEDDPQLRRTREIPLRQTAPGRYEARYPMDAFGSFVLTANHRRDGRLVAESATQLANPYPTEYRTLEPNETLLRAAADVTGGRMDPSPEQLFDSEGETIESHEELWPWLLYFVLGLFVFDLLLRRVRIFDRNFKPRKKRRKTSIPPSGGRKSIPPRRGGRASVPPRRSSMPPPRR